VQNAPREPLALLDLAAAGLDDGELIAAEPRQEVRFAHAAAQPLCDRFQKSVADRMTERVVHLLEAVEIEPMEGERRAFVQVAERVLERLAEMEAVGNAGQRIVPRKPLDFLLRPALFGDVLLDIDPTAVGERLIGHQELAAVVEVLDVREGVAFGQLGHVVGEPLRLLGDFVRAIPSGLAFHVVANDFGERRARERELLRQRIHFPVALVADDQALLGVEHR